MSYITVSAEKVKQDAQSVIDRIMKRRQEKDEAKITGVMTKTRYRFFCIKLTPFTKKQAIDYLKEYDWLTFPSQYAWGDLEKAKTLLIMAQNGDPVNISNDDARILWG